MNIEAHPANIKRWPSVGLLLGQHIMLDEQSFSELFIWLISRSVSIALRVIYMADNIIGDYIRCIQLRAYRSRIGSHNKKYPPPAPNL